MDSIDLSAPSAVTEARQLVSQINEERGFLSEEDLNEIGISTLDGSLAKNLYSSSARFVFELLQNADDSNFSRAIADGEEPYVSFRISPDKVVLECNEDGLTPENLRAICAIGKSSKIGAQGYIGEKGIAFKSVFKVAWQVHIQSNAFSFTFTHREGDSGMGMISPVWCEPEGTLDASLTRITLFLHQHNNPAEQERRYSNIVDQFNKLQGKSLLFLRKLRRVRLSIYDRTDLLISRIEHSLRGTDYVTIRKASLLGGSQETLEERLYYLTKHIANNVPVSENRSYAAEESNTDANTEIVLAFPLTEDLVPIDDENQDIYAFSSVRKMGFKFLIHADFETEASRQDIVVTSYRNQHLRCCIAECFIKAVRQFCQHPTLQFQWIRWLPRRDSYPWGEFWGVLLDEIDSLIQTSSIFRCQTDNRLENISSLRVLDYGHLDKAGNPLFGDLPSAIYLSQKYASVDLNILKPFGLKSLSINELLDIVSHDLQLEEDLSRIRSRNTDNDWHSRTTRLLLSCLKEGTKEQQQRVLSMKIIPLDTGKWASITTAPIYYCHCEGGIEIPQGLDLGLVSSAAAADSERRALFDELGVSTAPIRLVQDKIFSLSQKVLKDDSASLQLAVSHLRYLYLSHYHEEGEIAPEHLIEYPIYSATMQVRSAERGVFYLPTSDYYGPLRLLRGSEYQNWFIHNAYLKDPPLAPSGTSLSWVDWLCQSLDIRRHLRLTFWDKDKRKMKLSPELLDVSARRPGSVVGALHTSWTSQKGVFAKYPALIDKMRRVMVLDKHGGRVELGETYLPLPELVESYSLYDEGEEFPFLKLTEPVASRTYQEKWGFLVDVFGIGCVKDVQFYLRVLKAISQFCDPDVPVQRPKRFLNLYQTILGSCQAFDDQHDLVFIPAHGTNQDQWVSPQVCVWVGHGNLQTAYPLEHIYRTKFDLAEADLQSLKRYFKFFIGVSDCTWEDCAKELRELKKSDEIHFDWINEIYHYINQDREDILDGEQDELKQAFDNGRLIYADTSGSSCWHTASDCVWSSGIQIQGRVLLNEFYPDLEEFFVDLLGVTTLTLEMTYNELESKGSSNPAPPIQDVKAVIFEFNSLLQVCSSSGASGLKPLVGSKILPVQYPNTDKHNKVRLVDVSTEFAIVDRRELWQAFGSEVKLLDFTLNETRILGPFINWLGLGDRYLSIAVKEIPFVKYNNPSTRLVQNPERQIRKRAHGLLRIAMQIDSPRAGSGPKRMQLYRTLRQAKVYETYRITSELHLLQDNHNFKYIKHPGELHIREDGNGTLELYVSRVPICRDICYFETLPRRLLDWLMTDPVTNVKTSDSYEQMLDVIISILNAPLKSLPYILDAKGIVNTDDPKEDPDSDQDGD
ncbi:hypothetical protein F5Y10DRAFT_284107 [Nemania abortiva]|nr:hypothetical protein F5Y10DRAFT_284107 [Nemania abortiva]